MSHRRIDYLNLNRIIYNRYPINDKPTATNTSKIGNAPGTPKFHSVTRNNHIVKTL